MFVSFGEDISKYDTSEVTHWITNPAPAKRITRELIDNRFPNLEILASPSTGTTHISEEVIKSDIKILCLRDIDREKLAKITSSSEHTFFLFLALVRRSWSCLNSNLDHWRADLDTFRGRQVSGMQVLIFGAGRIGGNCARYLRAFGAEVFVYEPNLNVELPLDTIRITEAEILNYLTYVDAVFLCFHWSVDNNGFFDRSMLGKMRDDSYFVNTSRGENLDEEALCDYIRLGKFRGVALDVISNEQSIEFGNAELIKLARTTDRLIITPHIAGASGDSEQLAFEFIVEALIEYSRPS